MLRRQQFPGNHADAWNHGGIDANSGTAILLEVARAFADVSRRLKWRPRRTIVFCTWDGEEYGKQGATNFVEEYLKSFEGRLVAYLNADPPIVGSCYLRRCQVLPKQ